MTDIERNSSGDLVFRGRVGQTERPLTNAEVTTLIEEFLAKFSKEMDDKMGAMKKCWEKRNAR